MVHPLDIQSAFDIQTENRNNYNYKKQKTIEIEWENAAINAANFKNGFTCRKALRGVILWTDGVGETHIAVLPISTLSNKVSGSSKQWSLWKDIV